MTIQDTFMIDDTLVGLKTLEEIGVSIDPDASYRPFSVVDKLGDGSTEGNGFPVATWHFVGLEPGEADILYDFLNGNISAPIYFRTRLNRLNVGVTDYQWATFSGIMNWASGDENVPALHVLDLTITFTNLVLIPDYP